MRSSKGLLCLLLLGCGPSRTMIPSAAWYAAALKATSSPDAADVYDGLVALAAGEPGIEWGCGGEVGALKVATVMTDATCQMFYPEQLVVGRAPPEWGAIWVSAVPELRNFCSRLHGVPVFTPMEPLPGRFFQPHGAT